MEDPARLESMFKIAFMGKKGTGKSCTAIRIQTDTFPDFIKESSMGYQQKTKGLYFDDKAIKFSIFDIDGADKYMSVRKTAFDWADALVYFYDIADRSSFEDAKEWLEMMRKWRKDPPLLIVAGNKADLSGNRTVDSSEGRELAKNFDGIFFEISAKTGDSVREMVKEIVQLLMKPQERTVKNSEEKTEFQNEEKKPCRIF